MSLTKEEVMAVGIVIALNEKKRKRSKWTKGWLLKRDKISHTNLMKELKLDPDDWRNYMRMDESTYLELLNMVTPCSFVKRLPISKRSPFTKFIKHD